MAIDRSQKISAFKTSHQHKRNYNSVRACVGESQEIQAIFYNLSTYQSGLGLGLGLSNNFRRRLFCQKISEF